MTSGQFWSRFSAADHSAVLVFAWRDDGTWHMPKDQSLSDPGCKGRAGQRRLTHRRSDRERYITTDTNGYRVHAIIHIVDIQDRDGAPMVLEDIRYSFPWLRQTLTGRLTVARLPICRRQIPQDHLLE